MTDEIKFFPSGRRTTFLKTSEEWKEFQNLFDKTSIINYLHLGDSQDMGNGCHIVIVGCDSYCVIVREFSPYNDIKGFDSKYRVSEIEKAFCDDIEIKLRMLNV